MEKTENKTQVTIGGGCFWCIEALFQRVIGVSNVKSGYAGGTTQNPTYNQVCSGKTGHAEVIQFDYDSNIISYSDIIFIFLNIHDPTALKHHGKGSQYRSIILYQNEDEKQLAQAVINDLNKSKVYQNPIVTQVCKLGNFYTAEQKHQNFYNSNPSSSYCQAIVQPKLVKFFQKFNTKTMKN